MRRAQKPSIQPVFLKRIVSILLILLLTLLLLAGVVLFVLMTPSGQQFMTSQVNRYLKKKLDTRIEIGHIRLQWPKELGIENVYIEDLKGDTLLAARKLQAGVDMWGVLRGRIAIDQVVLEGVRGKVYRKAPDKDFNYQFIVDAFSSDSPADTTTGAPLDMSWNKLLIRQVHLSYYDDASGIDADVKLPDASVGFDAFNPSYSRYHPTAIKLAGAGVSLHTFEAADLGLPQEAPSATSDTLDLKLGDIDFRDVKVSYNDAVNGMSTELSFPKLLAMIDHVYLDGQSVSVKELSIEGARTIVLFESKEQKPAQETEAKPADTEDTGGWRIAMGKLDLSDNEIRYDDENVKPAPEGVDFSHLHLQGFGGEISEFIFSADSTAGVLKDLRFEEKSGFDVKELSAGFAYTSRQAFLKDLLFVTPHSTLGNGLKLTYASPGELADNPGKAGIELNLTNSKLGFRDLLLLAPDLAQTAPFDKKPDGFVQGNARLTGTVDNLQIEKAEFTMPEATRMAVTGTIKGLPDTDKMALNLDVQEISASRADILALVPKGVLPDSLELPAAMTLKGKLEGSLEALKIDAGLATDLGNVNLAGDFYNITDSLRASYSGSLDMSEVNVGRILMQPADQLGVVSLRADFSGSGLTIKGADAKLDGTLVRADVLGYTYRDLKLSGNIQNGLAGFRASMDDPNADLRIQGNADLNGEYPSVNMEAGIRRLDLNKLNLYADSISLAGNFSVNLSSSNPDNPLGTLSGTDVVLENRGEKIPLGNVRLDMTNEGAEKNLKLESPFANATMKGTYDYTAIGKILTAEIDRYIQLSDTLVPVPDKPYSIELAGYLTGHDALKAFVPALTGMERVNFSAKLSNTADTTIGLIVNAPKTVYDSTSITGMLLKVAGDGKNLDYNANVEEVLAGSFRVRNLSLAGNAAGNRANARLTVKDSVQKDQHAVGIGLRKDNDAFVMNLQNRILMNYRPWRTDSTGYIRYGKDGVLVKDFTLFRNRSREKLTINSVGDTDGAAPYPNGPIRIVADSVAIGAIVEMITRDPKLVSGRLDGDIHIRDYMGEAPAFKGDVSVADLEVQEVPMGDFELKAANDRSKIIDLVMSLKGEHNDLGLEGKYRSGNAEPFDFKLDMSRLDAKMIEAFSFGELTEGTGGLSGNLSIQGSTENPKLNGEIGLKDLAFRVKQIGGRYIFEDNRIVFKAPEMQLNNFAILDTLGQKLQINGTVSLNNIPEVGYNLRITSDRFMLLNASRKDNDLVYGKVFAAANLSVKGRGSGSVVDGSVKIQKGSDATLILPDNDGAVNRGDGVVEFVTRREEEMGQEESKEPAVVVDFASEMSLNIETDPEAEFTIVLDEMNGDNLKVRGNARLNTGLAPNGQLYLLGSYELEEGAYELTFEILKKQFLIRKGSQLIWSGDPMQAELDIVAVYGVQADPSAFSPTHYAYGKVPFNVLLRITGNLSNPRIAFDLEVDDKAGSALKNKIEDEQILSTFRNDPSEMNKQVFGLLLLNKFMAETSNVSFGGFNAEAIARQSVSKMLSDQLNNLASDLIKGVQLDFNLNSTTGTTGARTDLNVGLTKGFLNDRITVSVGRNFELENSGQSAQSSEIFDNIAVNYRVTRDGRYVFRAYRKNQFQTVLEGFIVETGVSFIVTLDYDRTKEFFK